MYPNDYGTKRYLKVNVYKKVPKDPIYPKGTQRSKVYKKYLMVQDIQKILEGPRYPKGPM